MKVNSKIKAGARTGCTTPPPRVPPGTGPIP